MGAEINVEYSSLHKRNEHSVEIVDTKIDEQEVTGGLDELIAQSFEQENSDQEVVVYNRNNIIGIPKLDSYIKE